MSKSFAWIEDLGWMLIHSVWTVGLTALIAALFCSSLRRHSAQARYAIGCIALLLSFLSLPCSLIRLQLRQPGDVHRVTSVERPIREGIAFAGSDRIHTEGAQSQTPDPSVEQSALPASPNATFDSAGENVPRRAISRLQHLIETWIRPHFFSLVICWLLGILLFSIRPLIGFAEVNRLRRSGHSNPSPQVLQILSEIANRYGLQTRVAVVQSSLVQIPCVLGCWRPVILLPVCALTGLTPQQLEAVLAHELAHISRYDYLINALQTMVETVMFYHPAVWWLSRRIRMEREFCCDDLVLQKLGNRSEYCRTLLAIEELRESAALPRLALGIGDGALLARVRRMIQLNTEFATKHDRNRSTVVPFLFLSVTSLLAMTWTLTGQDRARTNPLPIAEDRFEVQQIQDGERVSFSGRLVDSHGAAVEDAYVWFVVEERWEHSHEGPPIIAEARSGSDGRFDLSLSKGLLSRFVSRRSTQYQIWAHKPGLAVSRKLISVTPPQPPLDIEMPSEPTSELQLRNVDNSPCVDGTVTPLAIKFTDDPYQMIPAAIRTRLRANTNSEGQFRIGVARGDIVAMLFESPSAGNLYYGFHARDREIPEKLTLRQTGAIEGHLTFPAGDRFDPTQVQIRIATLDSLEHGREENFAGSAIIFPDRDGRFLIPRIAAGTVRIWVSEPASSGYRFNPPAQKAVVESGQTARITVPLVKAVKMTRQIRDQQTKQGIPGVRVVMEYQAQQIEARTDSSGRFSAWIVPGTRYHTVYDLPNGYISRNATADSETNVSTAAAQNELPPLEMVRSRTIEGIVVDAIDKPLSQVEVCADWKDPAEDYGFAEVGAKFQARHRTTTDAQGRFQLHDLPAHLEITLTPVQQDMILGNSLNVTVDDFDSVKLQATNAAPHPADALVPPQPPNRNPDANGKQSKLDPLDAPQLKVKITPTDPSSTLQIETVHDHAGPPSTLCDNITNITGSVNIIVEDAESHWEITSETASIQTESSDGIENNGIQLPPGKFLKLNLHGNVTLRQTQNSPDQSDKFRFLFFSAEDVVIDFVRQTLVAKTNVIVKLNEGSLKAERIESNLNRKMIKVHNLPKSE